MIEPVLELPSALNTKKSFLREIKLDSFRTSASSESDRMGFWNKVLNKRTPPESGLPNQSTCLRVELGGWVNLPPDYHDAVSLLLEYEDASGQHCCIIDEMNARGAAQVLLAGSADLQIRGRVKSMQVFCGGIADPSVWIDSMHLKTSEIDSGRMRKAS